MTLIAATQLPTDLWTNTFSYLSPQELATCEAVCRHLQKIASQNKLWECLAQQIRPTISGQKINYKQLLSIEARTLKTNEDIFQRVQAFVDKIALGQNARFSCVIQTGGLQSKIHLSITGTKDKPSELLDLTRDYIIYGLDTNAFYTEQSERYCTRSVTTMKLYGPSENILTSTIQGSPIQAVLHFPKVFSAFNGPTGVETSFISPIALEYRLTDIMNQKIEQLSDELKQKALIKKTTALGVFLIGGCCLYAIL